MTPATAAPPFAPRISIVGSGVAGIGMAIRLLQMGIRLFTIYEAAGEIGGTWRDNTYPGAACDVPSHLDSFSQYIAGCLRALRRRNARTMNLRPDVQRDFNARLQKTMQHSVWVSGCHSWYQTKSGKVTALWPGFTFSFRQRTRRVRPRDYRFAR